MLSASPPSPQLKASHSHAPLRHAVGLSDAEIDVPLPLLTDRVAVPDSGLMHLDFDVSLPHLMEDVELPIKSQPSNFDSVLVYDDLVQTQPFNTARLPIAPVGRVLLVSQDFDERMYLRARLALAKLVWVDEAQTHAQASLCMQTHSYVLGVFNLDSSNLDVCGLAVVFKKRNPTSVRLATTGVTTIKDLGLMKHWKHWQMLKRLGTVGFQEVLPKPLQPQRLSLWFDRINQDF